MGWHMAHRANLGFEDEELKISSILSLCQTSLSPGNATDLTILMAEKTAFFPR